MTYARLGLTFASKVRQTRPQRRNLAHLVLVLLGTTTLITATGCAAEKALKGGPIVDMKGVNPASYQRDLGECRQYADEVGVGQRAVASAAAGAVVGGLIGAAVGNSDTAKRSAGAGAVAGGASGTADGLAERNVVVKNCLRNRGYAVLN